MERTGKIKNIIEILNKEHDCVDKSYLSLRRCIGILGIMLPLVNIFGGWFISHAPVRVSLSAYYYTNMRDFFVGMLCVVALFLITYKGYSRIDQIITSVTGAFGLGVAVFPCSNEQFPFQKAGLFQLSMNISDTIHLICAVAFLTLLALNLLFLFTMTGPEKQMTKRKRWRNTIYIICGIIILVSISGAALCTLLINKELLEKYRVTLIFETFALISFGVSWLIKGQTLLKDKIQQPSKKTNSTAA